MGQLDYCQAMILTELERLQRSDFVRKETAREKYAKLSDRSLDVFAER